MNQEELLKEYELLKEKYERHEKILIQAYKSLKQREQELNCTNKRLSESEEELQAANEELRAVNEELFYKNEIIREQNEELALTLANLKKAQSQLIQSEKLSSIGILTAGMAHEINNPLNFIHGASIALETKLKDGSCPPDEETLKLIEAIKTGVERVTRLITSLSRFNRKSDSYQEKCDIRAIMENCLVMLNSKIKDRIHIEKKYHADAIPVRGNEGSLHQVFLNIIMNSIQAIPETGIIKIETHNDKCKIAVEISDSGSGIPEDIFDKVSDPFFTTRDTGKGTGLGLFISQNIVKDHNGTIDIFSKRDEGTRVRITLPVD